MATDNILTF